MRLGPRGRGEGRWPGVTRSGEDPFVKFPRVLLDRLLADSLPAEWKVISALVRRTYGWGQPDDQISASQFVDLTGLARSTVQAALRSLVLRGVICAERRRSASGGDDATCYRFVYEDEVGEEDVPAVVES